MSGQWFSMSSFPDVFYFKYENLGTYWPGLLKGEVETSGGAV